jgi:hypothetical protein
MMKCKIFGSDASFPIAETAPFSVSVKKYNEYNRADGRWTE